MQSVSRVALGLVGLLAAAGLVTGCGKAGSSGTQAPASNAAAGGCAPVAGDKLVVLDDDKHLQAADQVVPILRKAVANDEVKSILNKVSAGLTTADLVGLNAKVSLEHQDPDAVAKAYLEQKNYFS